MSIISYKDSLGRANWPDANLGSAKYYGVDWSDYLTVENDTIGVVTWTIPTGLTGSDENVVSDVARVKISADSVGEYEVSCQITSTEGVETQTTIQKMRLKVV
jgi:hypothetical protein